ncbi:PepSY-associated TM helix domain-containing protein [Thalassolituus marinus]|uniref:PepSY-associated TM helix domain-containing protein n=1 Tax=Thalassolituus marinus TaxID=671053 RepID=A0ABS7ZUI0_9GAMM|nr:PepSY-associated TM helix domain-containing protein [Thalassolituus marinus]MCA6064817.1 PepSY-associated TM helix domain-containing protein [Thalassolituus marinus]
MQRKLLVTIHLYLAAFFTPLVIAMAVTGGLYLLGVKGSVEKTPVATIAGQQLNLEKGNESARIDALLEQAGIQTDYAYVKTVPGGAITRPTSREYYELRDTADGVSVSRMQPDLIASLVELHKGHGPQAFRWLEIVFALGLVFIMVSGLYLGLQSPMLKNKTLVLSGAGTLVFIIAAVI